MSSRPGANDAMTKRREASNISDAILTRSAPDFFCIISRIFRCMPGEVSFIGNHQGFQRLSDGEVFRPFPKIFSITGSRQQVTHVLGLHFRTGILRPQELRKDKVLSTDNCRLEISDYDACLNRKLIQHLLFFELGLRAVQGCNRLHCDADAASPGKLYRSVAQDGGFRDFPGSWAASECSCLFGFQSQARGQLFGISKSLAPLPISQVMTNSRPGMFPRRSSTARWTEIHGHEISNPVYNTALN
jgi:hypothetical protein